MKANGMQKKKMTGNGFLLLITIALFAVMYIAGMIIFALFRRCRPETHGDVARAR